MAKLEEKLETNKIYTLIFEEISNRQKAGANAKILLEKEDKTGIILNSVCGKYSKEAGHAMPLDYFKSAMVKIKDYFSGRERLDEKIAGLI